MTGIKKIELNNENKNLFKDITQRLSKYDIILTSKGSTFDVITLLLGKGVFRFGTRRV